MELLDAMIKTGQFYDFMLEMIKTINEENENKTYWEFWLHKVYDMTFAEFLNSIQTNKAPTNEPSSRAEMEQTVRHSFEMLNNFSL